MASAATPASGELYYTRWMGSPGVARIAYAFDGTTFTLTEREDIASLDGADGILFLPDGRLLVGGGSTPDAVYAVRAKPGGKVEARTMGGAYSFHLALDNDQTRVWSGGIPGNLVEVGIHPFTDGVIRFVSGDDNFITGIAFDRTGRSYYTSSNLAGNGSFGLIDLKTYTTTRVLSLLPAAHGMFFDPFTDSLILSGQKHVTQIDPKTLTVISDLDLSALPALNTGGSADFLDQGAGDGLGHVFVAVNNGYLVFIDMTKSRLVSDPTNVVRSGIVDANIDDIAPLSWLGSIKNPKVPKDPKSPKSPKSPSSPVSIIK